MLEKNNLFFNSVLFRAEKGVPSRHENHMWCRYTVAPFNYHGEKAEESEMYTQIEMSLMEAIKTTTSIAVQSLR